MLRNAMTHGTAVMRFAVAESAFLMRLRASPRISRLRSTEDPVAEILVECQRPGLSEDEGPSVPGVVEMFQGASPNRVET